MKIKYIKCVFLMLFFMCAGCDSSDSVLIADEMSTESENIDTVDLSEDARTDTEQEINELYVYVCGHVGNPGVYRLTEGSRVCDAIEAAGGVTADGQSAVLEQAKILVDEQTVYVPGIDEAATEGSLSGDGKASAVDDGKININTAAKEELLSLPGIGESKADDIIRFREEHGKFESVEDIMNIQGIKEGVFNKIKDQISI